MTFDISKIEGKTIQSVEPIYYESEPEESALLIHFTDGTKIMIDTYAQYGYLSYITYDENPTLKTVKR